jgi:hypothetical protein
MMPREAGRNPGERRLAETIPDFASLIRATGCPITSPQARDLNEHSERRRRWLYRFRAERTCPIAALVLLEEVRLPLTPYRR